jgi:hypothetical protein
MCNMGIHHAMVVTQMWKYNNKFCTYLVVSARISEHLQTKDINNLLSRKNAFLQLKCVT